MGLKLYEIAQGMQYVSNLFDNEEITEEMKVEALEHLTTELKNKGNNIIALVKQIEGESDMLTAEIKRLTDMKRHRENKIESIKAMTSRALETMGIDEVKSDIGKINFRKSETTEIDDEKQIPPKFITIVPESYKYDKTAIKKAIKYGEIVTGAHIEQHKHIQIK